MVIDVDSEHLKNEPLSSQKKANNNAILNKQALLSMLSPKNDVTKEMRKVPSLPPGYSRLYHQMKPSQHRIAEKERPTKMMSNLQPPPNNLKHHSSSGGAYSCPSKQSDDDSPKLDHCFDENDDNTDLSAAFHEHVLKKPSQKK